MAVVVVLVRGLTTATHSTGPAPSAGNTFLQLELHLKFVFGTRLRGLLPPDLSMAACASSLSSSIVYSICSSPSSLSKNSGPLSRLKAKSAQSEGQWRLRRSNGGARSQLQTSEAPADIDPARILIGSGEDKLEICRVINGMWQTSGGWGKIEPPKAVDAMLRHVDSGFTTFDMADHYGPAEDLYGLLINRVRRERGEEMAARVQGLTKWVPSPVKMTRDYVEANIDRSRKRMDVKCLDMLQFHWWDYSKPGYLDALKHLADLKEEGKIKTVALTNFDTKRLQIILENGIPIASNQVQHSLVDMRPQKRMAELCSLTGVRLITYGTVMGGLLSDKFLDANITIPFAGPPLDTPSLNKYKRMVDAWGGWKLFQELLRTCKGIANKHGVSISTVAVRYILDQPTVAGSMVGVRLGISEHVKDSQAVFALKLEKEDVETIDAVAAKGRDLFDVIGDCGDEYRG